MTTTAIGATRATVSCEVVTSGTGETESIEKTGAAVNSRNEPVPPVASLLPQVCTVIMDPMKAAVNSGHSISSPVTSLQQPTTLMRAATMVGTENTHEIQIKLQELEEEEFSTAAAGATGANINSCNTPGP